ncbi:hypothetical protein [Methanosarcina horonobensis]|uniref:hypothetical protein n=1 Tax=Methanosarcina horonobensis TaxID=418008 RepID=UPI000AB7881B|nr:hypothetical protein [Methanosarcina horonobensis]
MSNEVLIRKAQPVFLNNLDSAPQGSYSFFSRNRFWHEALSVQKQTASLLEGELRSTIAYPRTIPRPLREKIAEIIAFEILFEQPYEIKDTERFIGLLGAFYPIFLTLRNSRPWPGLQKIAKRSRGAGVACLKLLLPLIYDLMERFSAVRDRDSETGLLKGLDAETEAILREFEKLLKQTVLLWAGGSSEDSLSRSAQFPASVAGKSNIYEAILNLMQKDGCQTFLDGMLEGLYCRMQEFISEMEENLDLFDTLALLFPGRNWSYSVKELKREPFYVQLKMLKNYSAFFEKNPDLRKIINFIGRREFDPPAARIRYSPFGKKPDPDCTIFRFDK